MKQTISLIMAMLLILLTPQTSLGKDYAGVKVPEQINYGGQTMALNGVGLRKKLFISLYVGSLYLKNKSNDAEKIMAEDAPMAIRLAIKSSMISAKKMKDATLEGFQKSTNGDTAPIQPHIDELLKTFDMGVGPGDVYELINIPGSGVHVIRNGIRAATIRSLDFKKALFGIWLSNNPVQQDLKLKMLGS